MSHAHTLTPRELEVVKLVCTGLTNREIGQQLTLSHRTVEVHRFHAMKKLDVTNAAQLVRCSLESKLIKPSPLARGERNSG